ncbi:MAG: hypothetical protein ACLU19_10700 [Faecalibacterium sp.]
MVDIGRSHAVLYLYDMALQCVFRTVLPDHGGDGNELLTSISDAIFQGFSMEELHAGKMKSIGLLFQDDTEISEFRVMYSTGYTAATISLREALFTQFKVPIVEEYSRVYTVSRALAEAGKSVGNPTMHIDLATGPWCRSCGRILLAHHAREYTSPVAAPHGSLQELANLDLSPARRLHGRNARAPRRFYGAAEQCGTDACSLFVIEKPSSARRSGPGVHARGGAEAESPEMCPCAEPGSRPYACLYGNGSAPEPAGQRRTPEMKLAVVYGENKGASPQKEQNHVTAYLDRCGIPGRRGIDDDQEDPYSAGATFDGCRHLHHRRCADVRQKRGRRRDRLADHRV